MALSIASIKQELARNRKRAAILGILSAVMLAMMARAYMQMSPRHAAAAPAAMATPEADDVGPVVPAAEADERLALSRNLWKVLRDVRGMPPVNVFTFDAQYFPLDPTKPHPLPVDAAEPAARPMVRSAYDDESDRDAGIAAIRDQARMLVVRSTVVNAGSPPVAVINDRILTVGDHIDGFEITAIRAREVEFKKDDVTQSVKMVDMPRGQ